MDCVIRRDDWVGSTAGFRNVPGMNIVGTIVIAGPDATFKVGNRVAAVVQTGGNTRLTVCSSKILLAIDERDEAHRVCAILAAYMPAFSLIQQGVSDTSERYRDNPLYGHDIFVNGAMSSHGQAVVHLARLFGAKHIYATGKPKDYQHFKDLGALPLPLFNDTALEKMDGSIDLIIDTTAFDMLEILTPLRVSGSRVVFDQHGDIAKNGKHGFRSKLDFVILTGKIFLARNCYLVDYLQCFNQHFSVFKVRRLSNKERLSV